MKKILLSAAALILGAGVGGGAAFGTATVLGGKPLFRPAEPAPVFVPTGPVLAPLVSGDGRLAGYASFEVQLEVTGGKDALVTQNIPLLLNAINMRTHRTPMASGADGLIPDLDVFRRVVMESAAEVYGAGTVRKAAVVQATPV